MIPRLSLDAIRAFAGDSIDAARYFPQDDVYLLTKPRTAVHYDLAYLEAPTG